MHKKSINLQVVIRILIGLLLFASGGEKLLSHYQNFLYVVQSYTFLPDTLERSAAFVLPWFEFLTGIFLLLGFGLRWTLKCALVLFMSFILVVSQAIIRGLPIDECGCFGEYIHFPLHVIVLFDSFVFLSIVFLIRTIDKTSNVSLDQYFSS